MVWNLQVRMTGKTVCHGVKRIRPTIKTVCYGVGKKAAGYQGITAVKPALTATCE